ncbi:fumarate hydratase [Thermococci archaeon]|nr:MAG: fumarate hydratase [Thermococci archaeon]
MAVNLKTPLGEDILNLKAGDIVYLSGTIFTARDLAHRRMIKLSKRELPFDPSGAVIYHCGPIIKEIPGGYEVISAGPTTSARMNTYLEDVLSMGIKGIIGKGGMDPEPFKKYGAVYFAFTGGAGALAARSIKRVLGVQWLDLGIPEALWLFEVENFPLVIAIDSRGNSLYKQGKYF